MRTSSYLLITVAAGASLAGCTAQAPAAPGRSLASRGQCFLASQVNGFGPNANGAVDISVGANRYYRLDLGGGCPNVNWSTSVGIRATGGGSFICEGYDAELVVPDPSGTQHCPISRITPISRAEYYASRHR
jgi:hypothetical protein